METSKKISKISARRTTQGNNRKSIKSRSSEHQSEGERNRRLNRLNVSDASLPWEENDPEGEARWNVQSSGGHYSTRGKNEDYDYDEDDQEDENLFISTPLPEFESDSEIPTRH